MHNTSCCSQRATGCRKLGDTTSASHICWCATSSASCSFIRSSEWMKSSSGPTTTCGRWASGSPFGTRGARSALSPREHCCGQQLPPEAGFPSLVRSSVYHLKVRIMEIARWFPMRSPAEQLASSKKSTVYRYGTGVNGTGSRSG